MLMAIAAGVVAYVTATAAHVPGATPLAVWVALWDLIPVIGGPIGALPIVMLALVLGSVERGLIVLAVFVAYHVTEALVLQPRLESRSMHVGPFLTIAAGVVGVELYGIGGALLAIALTTFASAVLAEVVPPLAEEQPGAPEVSNLVQGGDRADAAS